MMTDEAMTILANFYLDAQMQGSLTSDNLPESIKSTAIESMKEYWRQNPDVFERQWAEFLELSVPTRRIYG